MKRNTISAQTHTHTHTQFWKFSSCPCWRAANKKTTQLVSLQQLSALICLPQRHNNKSWVRNNNKKKRKWNGNETNKHMDAKEWETDEESKRYVVYGLHGVCVMSSRLNGKLRLLYESKKHFSRHTQRRKTIDKANAKSQANCCLWA